MPNITTMSPFPCTGCGTCYVLCGRKAITLKEDEAGFLVAQLDESACVDCGMCISACARFFEEFIGEELDDGAVYALQSSDPEQVKRGSSGGFAHALAQRVIQLGGKAIGAEYDYATDRVEHRIIENISELYRIDGTKYLQSNCGGVFAEAFRAARKDPDARFAVFGTPCQIQGFSDACFLHPGSREHFLLVEVFCQGVAGYRLWDEECAAIRQQLGCNGPFDWVNFRSHAVGWNDYCLQVDAGGATYLSADERDLFQEAFFERALLRESCVQCRQRGMTSTADIRIGDDWHQLAVDDQRLASDPRCQLAAGNQRRATAVIALTDTGIRAVEDLIATGAVTALEHGTVDDVLAHQHLAFYSVKQQAMHREAMAVLRNGGTVREAILAYRKLKDFWGGQ